MPTDLEHDLTELLRTRATGVNIDPGVALVRHRQRLRAAGNRRLAVLGVAVVAIIGGATLMVAHRPAATESAAAPPLSVTTTTAAATTAYPTFRLADFTAQGTNWVIWGVLKGTCLDVVGMRAGQPPNPESPDQYPGGLGRCSLTPGDRGRPLILEDALLAGPDDQVNTSPVPNVTLWVTTPDVAAMTVTLADRHTVPLRLLGATNTLHLFLCDQDIKNYRADTYYDATGKQVYRDTTRFDK